MPRGEHKRTPITDAVYRVVREAGEDGADRDSLVDAAQRAGASLDQARKAVGNMIQQGRLQRRIVEGHTTLVLPPSAPRAAEPVPPAGGGAAPAVKRGRPPRAPDAAPIAVAVTDSPFRCGVLDTGELLIVQGERHATFTAQESERLWRVLQRHHGEVTR